MGQRGGGGEATNSQQASVQTNGNNMKVLPRHWRSLAREHVHVGVAGSTVCDGDAAPQINDPIVMEARTPRAALTSTGAPSEDCKS